MDAAGARVRGSYEALRAQQKEVSAVVKSAAFRRALEADPALGEQVQVFKQDREETKAAHETLKALKEKAGAELGALAKLLQG